ncbi:RNA polymerase sigma factor, region 2 [Cinara cedri]|uniref:RNA polymerase sigma factor, region 2 n=1 Tax=Cinara cedri TaxID=506608 RepID=A0A5E4NT42_9HEMI|nr:RNA polymerase sigma factor, region 2 [Cinara cedri]
MLSQEEEMQLAKNWHKHQDISSAHKLITSHLSLVVKVAMKLRNYGLSLMDLIMEGNIGNNNSTSSGKKLINALLLTPVIVPTAITLSLIGCTYLCLNAVKAQDDDSTLSQVTKATVRYLIYMATFVVLSTCIVLNLAISLVPFLIFRVINKGIFNKESNGLDVINTTDVPGQVQPTNTILTDSEYKEHISDALNKLNSSTEPINNENEELNQRLISPTQPTVQVISRNTGNQDQEDETIIVDGINNARIQNGKAVIISKINKEEVHFTYVAADDHVIPDNNAMKSSAAACNVHCKIVDDGVDFSVSASVRTGETQKRAMKELLQSKVARRILSNCEVEVQAITQDAANK